MEIAILILSLVIDAIILFGINMALLEKKDNRMMVVVSQILFVFGIVIFWTNWTAMTILIASNIVGIIGIKCPKILPTGKWKKVWLFITMLAFVMVYPVRISTNGGVDVAQTRQYELTSLEENDEGIVVGFSYMEEGEEKIFSIPEDVERELIKTSLETQKPTVAYVQTELVDYIHNDNSLLSKKITDGIVIKQYRNHYKFLVNKNQNL